MPRSRPQKDALDLGTGFEQPVCLGGLRELKELTRRWSQLAGRQQIDGSAHEFQSGWNIGPVNPLRIADSPASFECRVREIIPLGEANHLILVNVLAAHVIDEAITDRDRCRIDASRLDLIGRMESPGWCVRKRDRFMLTQTKPEAWNASKAQV